MVIVEPYRWIKSTAIKERLDLANKLNEVIDVLNGGVVTIEDIDLTVTSEGVFTFIFTLSDGAVKEMSFDMGDYIDNTVASAISSALTGYVSKTGVSEVTGDIRVPTTPANPLTVVNSVYVNDATEGVNNILHKTGNETKTGQLTVTNHLTTNEDFIANSPFATPVKLYKNNLSKENQQYGSFQIAFYDAENYELARLICRLREDGSTALVGQARKPNGTWVEQTIIEGIA